MRIIMNADHTPSMANHFAVPTLETALRLCFLKTTAYAWYKNYYGSVGILTYTEADFFKERYGEKYVTFLCKAPQLHELIAAFPEKRADFLQAINNNLMEGENLTEACAISIIEGK